MSKSIEIERRFLLKRAPSLSLDSFTHITQIYVEEDGQDVRYRGEAHGPDKIYTRTVKKELEGSLVREEDETESTQEEFIKKAQGSDRIITKVRSIYKDGDLNWEIDQFRFLDLIIVEVELPTKDYDLEIPQEIQDVMIMEVTGIAAFHNSVLADDYEKV